MSVLDRLQVTVWPTEKNVGGIHRTARYLLAPVLGGLGLAVLAGVITIAPGLGGTVIGIAGVLGGVISLVEAHTQKCPGYAMLGVNTCELPTADPVSGTEEVT